MNMNAVGIDVSKGKSMVAILRPYGEMFLHHLKSSIQSAVFALLSNTFKPLMVSHAL